MKSIYACLLVALGFTVLTSGCTRPYRPMPVGKVKATAVAPAPADEEAEIQASLAKLSVEDRALAKAQGFCAAEPENRLGSMGPPLKYMIKGQPVFICCKGCETDLKKDEDKTLAIVQELRERVAELAQEREILANLAKLPKEDLEFAELQKYCPIERSHRLGTVGVPVKVKIKDEEVYLCCKDCKEAAEKEPDRTLAIVTELNIAGNLAKLSPEDRKVAQVQGFCPAQPDNRLGIMGPPFKFMIKGQPVFVCCKGCGTTIKKDEDKTLSIVEDLKKKTAKLTPPK